MPRPNEEEPSDGQSTSRGRVPCRTRHGLLAVAPGGAVDGVLEINQACAVNTGCFPGDGAGFPVTIAASRSYRLTGNLSVSSGATTAVDITADFVALDLNGFSISGITTCTPPTGPVTGCSNTGAGVGVHATGGAVGIERGLIRGMGSHGIEVLGAGSLVDGVGFTSNGGDGVHLGLTAVVRHTVSGRNGGDGIHVTDGSQVTDSLASANAGDGIEVLSASHVVRTHTSENAGNGIRATTACVLKDNIATSNLATGIEVVRDGVIVDNSSSFNATGLDLGLGGSPSSYAGNVFNVNATNVANSGNGIETGTNICGGNTTCP